MPMSRLMLRLRAWFKTWFKILFKIRFKLLFGKHWYFLIICSLRIVLVIILCDTSNQAAGWESESADSSSLHVGSSRVETDNPWGTAQVNSFRKALLPNGIDFIYHEPGSHSVQWQLESICNLVREGVDHLVIASTDPSALTPVFQGTKDVGIPIILIGQSTETIDQSYYVSLISADYPKGDQTCTGLLADRFGNQPYRIAEIYGTESSSGTRAHSKGFCQALMKYPNTETIDMECGNLDQVTVQKATENAPIKVANRGQTMNVVFAHSDEDGLGTLQAIKVAGLPPGEIAIVSISGIQDVCKVIIAREHLGTVEGNPRWGFIAALLIR